MLNREFGRHIIAKMKDSELNYRQLSVIQKAVNKYSVSFPDPNDTFKNTVDTAFNKVLKEL